MSHPLHIVPGHGPVGTRIELIEYRQMLFASRERIAALKKQGHTLAEIVAKKPTRDYDEKFGQFWIDPAFFIRLVYSGV